MSCYSSNVRCFKYKASYEAQKPKSPNMKNFKQTFRCTLKVWRQPGPPDKPTNHLDKNCNTIWHNLQDAVNQIVAPRRFPETTFSRLLFFNDFPYTDFCHSLQSPGLRQNLVISRLSLKCGYLLVSRGF